MRFAANSTPKWWFLANEGWRDAMLFEDFGVALGEMWMQKYKNERRFMRFCTACKCAKNWLEMGGMVLKTWFCGIKVVKTTNNGVEMCVE